jgi:PhnB protein
MSESANEDQIRAAIDARADAIRKKNVQGVLNQFAEESVRFFLATPLQATVPLKDDLEDWFATWQGPIGYEIRDLKITASDDVAFSHSLSRYSGTKTDGEKPDVWFRDTLCFRKINGQWLITHAHESVPFYMDGSYKAAVDLKP